LTRAAGILLTLAALLLSTVLANHTLEDVSVEDPPLEEVIAQVFAQSAEKP